MYPFKSHFLAKAVLPGTVMVEILRNGSSCIIHEIGINSVPISGS